MIINHAPVDYNTNKISINQSILIFFTEDFKYYSSSPIADPIL